MGLIKSATTGAWISVHDDEIPPENASSGGGGGAATVADGADVTQGAIADASSTTGTISAKLRAIATSLALNGAETTVTPAKVTLSSNTSATLLVANANRIRFIVNNPLATSLYVRKGAAVATAAADGNDVAVPAGGSYVSDAYEYAGQIRCICATAGDVGISESV